MLKLQVIGNVGNDAEIKEHNGEKFLTFDLASNRSYKDAAGVKHTVTTWISCTYKRTEAGPYLKKGTTIYAEGYPTINAYHSQKNNAPAANFQLRISNLTFCGGGTGTGQAQQ